MKIIINASSIWQLKKNILQISIYSFLFISCSTTKNSLKGRFETNHEIKDILDLKENGFVYTRLQKTDRTIDTIAFGDWRCKNGVIELTSPDSVTHPLFYLEVDEFTKDNDTIYIYIDNKLEREFKKDSSNRRGIKYKITIYSNNNSFDEDSYFKEYNTNIIKLPKPDRIVIEKLEVSVVPVTYGYSKNIELGEITSLEYYVADSNKNIFYITIPSLSSLFFKMLRLNSDYVKVIDENKLRWDGKEYIKVKQN